MKYSDTLPTNDIAYSINMAPSCPIIYWIMAFALSSLVETDTDYLGGMWAAVAAVFVFRDSRENNLSAGISRFIATCVSFLLCTIYLCIFPFTPLGMAALVCIGTSAMTLLGCRDDIITTEITTVVVMVVAAIYAKNT